MMKGNNQLHLNKATVMQALQQWLDRNIAGGGPTVYDISWHLADGTTIVSVKEREQK